MPSKKRGCECHLDQFVDLDLDLCYLRLVWLGDGREHEVPIDFAINLCLANKATARDQQ